MRTIRPSRITGRSPDLMRRWIVLTELFMTFAVSSIVRSASRGSACRVIRECLIVVDGCRNLFAGSLPGEEADETEKCVKCSACLWRRIFVGTIGCGLVSLDHNPR